MITHDVPEPESPTCAWVRPLFKVNVLDYFPFTFHFHALEKEMATHSSVLAWRIPGTKSLVGCRLWGRTESDTTEATQPAACMRTPARCSPNFICFYPGTHLPSSHFQLPLDQVQNLNWVLAIAMWVEFLGESGARKDCKEHSHCNPPHTSARTCIRLNGREQMHKVTELGGCFSSSEPTLRDTS